jgi:hypothetical protein
MVVPRAVVCSPGEPIRIISALAVAGAGLGLATGLLILLA